MNLTWHIVRKDIARLAVPLGAWIAFVVATTAWFGLARPPSYASTVGILAGWAGNLHGFGLAGAMMQATIGALLGAVFVLEDPPVGTTAFWLTRPIRGARMLAAKALGAALCFAILPALALAGMWLAFGFSLGEAGLAALEFAGWQLVVTVPVLALGVVTGSLGHFVFAVLGVWLLVVVTVVAGNDGSLVGARPEWVEARGAAVVGILVLGGALTFARSFFGGRRRAWLLLAVTLAAMVALRVAWTRDDGRTATQAPEPAEESVVRMALARTAVQWELPLREGVEARAGATLSRIVNLGWGDDRKQRRLVLYERDARLAGDYGVHRHIGEHSERRHDEIKADHFILVNRTRGYARRLPVHEVGTARMNSVMVTARILEFAAVVPVGADFARWDEEATIVKVRLSNERGAGSAAPAGGETTAKEKKS